MTKSIQLNEYQVQALLTYLEELADYEPGMVWTEYHWKSANSQLVWFLRDVLKDPNWMEE